MTTTSTQEIVPEPQAILPPLIVNNPRQKIEAQQIPLTALIHTHTPSKRSHHATVDVPVIPQPQPEPLLPLEMSCRPTLMCFELDQDTVRKTLRLRNPCKRSIYVLCCGLWDDTARLGASWLCSPRTRILLPPGFMAKITIKATPKGSAPIPYATSALQVALGHRRDNVVGYIVIPICVKFLSYQPPVCGEGG